MGGGGENIKKSWVFFSCRLMVTFKNLRGAPQFFLFWFLIFSPLEYMIFLGSRRELPSNLPKEQPSYLFYIPRLPWVCPNRCSETHKKGCLNYIVSNLRKGAPMVLLVLFHYHSNASQTCPLYVTPFIIPSIVLIVLPGVCPNRCSQAHKKSSFIYSPCLRLGAPN